MQRLTLITFCALITVACSPPGHRDEPPNSLFERGARLGKVDMKLREASGLVASIANPGMLWTHNDGKNPSEIFLIDDEAKIRMTCKLKVKNRTQAILVCQQHGLL